MRRGCVSGLGWLLVAVVGLGVEPPAAHGGQSRFPPVPHSISVVRFHTLDDFTEVLADALIAEMERVLQDDEGGTVPDFPCPVAFRREGPVGTFMDGDGVVDTRAKFLEVVGADTATVKVVAEVSWCETGAPVDPVDVVDTGSFGACADLNSGSFVVEGGLTVDVGGPLWAHEFGHLEGLPSHRRGEPLMVMNDKVDSNSRRVDESECRAFTGP